MAVQGDGWSRWHGGQDGHVRHGHFLALVLHSYLWWGWRGSLVGTVLVWRMMMAGFDALYCVTWVCGCTSGTPALSRQRQEDQELKFIFGCVGV